MKTVVNMIELGVSIIIMVAMVFLTLLSSETASVKIEPKRDSHSTMTSKPDSILDLRER
jgi:hypothetical protein